MIRVSTILLVAVSIGLLGLVSPAGASADSEIAFSIQPLAGTPAAAKGYFVVPADPGGQVTQTVSMRNTSDKTIEVRVAAVDASTGPYGGASYGTPGEPVKQMGAWIALPLSSIRLGAGEARDIDFVISVPADAAPGDHLAGLAAWIAARSEESSAAQSGQAGAVVTVQTRRLVAVQVVVPGPAEPEIVIAGVTAAARPNGMNLEIAISSPGGLLTNGNGTIELPDAGFTQDFALDTFVPGTTIAYPIQWKTAPKVGTYPAHVILHYGDQGAKTAEWSGEFAVVDKNLAELKDRVVAPETPAGAASSTPWLVYGLIGGLVLIVLIMGFALLRRRRPEPKA